MGREPDCSLELGNIVDVPLEGAVVDVGAGVVEVGHDGLVLGTVPSDIPRLSVAVSVHILVVLMVHWGLTSLPLAVCIRHRRVLGQDTSNGPVEQFRVVDEGLGVEGMVVKDEGTVVTETATDTTDDEVADPTVCEPATNVEVLDGQLTDDGKAEEDTNLSAGGVVSPVEVRLVGRSRDHAQVSSGEPALEDGHIVHGLRGPLELSLSKGVFGDTETDQLAILNVVSNLRVDSSPDSVVVGVLYRRGIVSFSGRIYLPALPGWSASPSCTCPRCGRKEFDLRLRSS